MENLLEQNQLSYLNDELSHPRMGKLKITNHIKEQLVDRFGTSIREVAKNFHNFNHQTGTKRCPHLRVIDQKINAGNYPNSDYLYLKGLNMIISVDRKTKTMVTVLHFNTDYYKG